MWTGRSSYSQFSSSKSALSWRWFKPCARIKFTVSVTTVIICSMPKTSPHRASWYNAVVSSQFSSRVLQAFSINFPFFFLYTTFHFLAILCLLACRCSRGVRVCLVWHVSPCRTKLPLGGPKCIEILNWYAGRIKICEGPDLAQEPWVLHVIKSFKAGTILFV